MGACVPLQIDPHNENAFSNIQEFVNSLFDPDVRTLDPAQAAVTAGETNFLYCDDNSASLILQSWLAAWQHSVGDTYDLAAYNRCPGSDRTVIAFLAGYIKSHSLSMAVPNLEATNAYEQIDGHALRQFRNNGYYWRPFLNSRGQWNYGTIYSNDPLRLSNGDNSDDTVLSFLYHFLRGAHFVVASTDGDQSDRNGFGTFLNAFVDACTCKSTVSSHYADHFNLTCQTYPAISGETEPSTKPLVIACMSGDTTINYTDKHQNSFFQHEGWPAQGVSGGDRHMDDYDNHKATLWNFSTYGGCAYSEKRCAPLFLGRSTFSLTLQNDTKMPHYDGARSVQSWMHTSLMTF
jgi:hypothetical protein